CEDVGEGGELVFVAGAAAVAAPACGAQVVVGGAQVRHDAASAAMRATRSARVFTPPRSLTSWWYSASDRLLNDRPSLGPVSARPMSFSAAFSRSSRSSSVNQR